MRSDMKYLSSMKQLAASVALVVLVTSGCAAGSSACPGESCDANPVTFLLRVEPPNDSDLIEHTFSVSGNPASGTEYPPLQMVRPFIYENRVMRTDPIAGDVGMADATVFAQWPDDITDVDTSVAVTADSDGYFSMSLLPGRPVRLVVVPPPSHAVPPMVIPVSAPLALPVTPLVFGDPADYYVVAGETKIDGSPARPLPNVRVRALRIITKVVVGADGVQTTEEEVVPNAGVSTVVGCDGTFSLRLPPNHGELYRIRMERLDAGTEPACDIWTEIDACTSGTTCASCNAPDGVPVVPTQEQDLIIDVGKIADPPPVSFVVGTDGCPPASVVVNVALTANDTSITSPDLDLSGTSIRFVSVDDPTTMSIWPDGVSYRMTVPAPNITSSTLSVILPVGNYDVEVRTGPLATLASETFSYMAPLSSMPAPASFDLSPKTELTGVIRDSDSVKIEGALVEAREADKPHTSVVADMVVTDDRGVYSLRLSPGVYDLTIRPPDGATWAERRVAVVAGDISERDVNMLPFTLLLGSVEEEITGLDLENARVTAYIRFVADDIAYPLAETTTSSADTSLGLDGGTFEFLLPNPSGDARECMVVAGMPCD